MRRADPALEPKSIISPCPFLHRGAGLGYQANLHTMNAERFQAIKDGFDTLDLRARFDFKTNSSIGFKIKSGLFETVIGAMQVHHPCFGHIKAQIYFQLPNQYCDAKKLIEMGMQAFRELDIPQDETYEFNFDLAEGGMIVEQPVDRNGITDRV